MAHKTASANTSGTLYNAIRLFACVLTLAAIGLRFYLPERTLVVQPNEQVYPAIYATGDERTQAVWVNEEDHIWRCTGVWDNWASCGYSLSWGAEVEDGKDFSDFSKLRISLDYDGPARYIRIFMRNFDPSYASRDDDNSTKFMAAMVRAEDLNGAVEIGFNEFVVAEWWIANNDLPRHLTLPQFDNIQTVGIDYTETGEHWMRVNRIELVGEWISAEQLYLSIILLWMMVIIWETVSRFYRLYKRSRNEQRMLETLVTSYSRLESEKRQYQTLSTTDPLTQTLNRNGLAQRMEHLLDKAGNDLELSLLLLDIDFFKSINDSCGHDVGDRVLSQFASLLQANIRENDILARWGGEEFILVCPNTHAQSALGLAEKLRSCVASFYFADAGQTGITVSIGAASYTPGDRFEDLFKRADIALYGAKQSGRNQVRFEGKNQG